MNHGRAGRAGTGTLWTTTDVVHRLADRLVPGLAAPDATGMFADADSLNRLAGHIAGHADDLRDRASRLLTAAAATRWESTAAARFQAEVRELAGRYRRAAGGIDDAADALRQHASNVRREQAVLAGAEHALAKLEHLLGI